MNNQKFFLFFVVAVLAILISSCSHNQNWPGWRGPNRDGHVIGFKTPAVWPAELKKIWQVEVGLGDASISSVDSKLYLLVKQDSNEVALCLEPTSGNQIWRTVLNPAPVVTGGPSSHPGPRSTPEVADGRVFTLGTGGTFTCLDAVTGKILWQDESYPVVPQFYTAMSPLVVGNLCLAHLGGHDDGTVVAFNVENGNKIWTLFGEPATYSSPVLLNTGGSQLLVVQTETDVLGISMEGKIQFRIPTPASNRFYNSSTPVINGMDVIIAGQGTGTKSFTLKQTGKAFTFKEHWSNPDIGVSFNTPVLKDGYLYGNESSAGKLYCMNASTGATCWEDTLRRSPFASMLDLGKVMLSLPETGELVFFEPNQKKFVRLAGYKVAETPVYAHPLVEGDKIYVKDKEYLTCWSVAP